MGISSQKAQYDSCIHWLILINGGIIAILIKEFDELTSNGHDFILLLSGIGLLWTLFMMIRACRAYQMLINFDYMLNFILEKLIHSPSKSAVNINQIVSQIKVYDYGPNMKYKLTKWECIKKHLPKEFGFSLAMFIFVLFKTTDHVCVHNLSGGIIIIIIFYILIQIYLFINKK